MATPRFRRVNIDGLSKTETRLAAAALLPGTFAYIPSASNKFTQATAARGRLYVINPAYSQGLGILDPVPLDVSAVGDYVEEGREFAVRMAGGTSVVKDQPITVGAAGLAVTAVEGGPQSIIGYSQETVTLPAGAGDFVRIRVKYFAAVAATGG